MKYPSIIKVELKKVIRPNMSSGTGYDKPSIYVLTADTGETFERILENWYRPLEDTVRNIREICYNLPILNPMDTFYMFLECYKKEIGIKE